VVYNLLISGRPGVGKTTVLKKVARHFEQVAAGFYTEEIREAGVRKGFAIRTLDGKTGLLAHVDAPSPYRVGKYRVLVADFDQVAVEPLFRRLRNARLFIIDEIGKMEFFSQRFVELVFSLLDHPVPVVASIMARPHPLADRIKQRPDVKLIEVKESNRDGLPDQLIREIEQILQGLPR